MGSHREPASLLLRRHDVEGELRAIPGGILCCALISLSVTATLDLTALSPTESDDVFTMTGDSARVTGP